MCVCVWGGAALGDQTCRSAGGHARFCTGPLRVLEYCNNVYDATGRVWMRVLQKTIGPGVLGRRESGMAGG